MKEKLVPTLDKILYVCAIVAIIATALTGVRDALNTLPENGNSKKV